MAAINYAIVIWDNVSQLFGTEHKSIIEQIYGALLLKTFIVQEYIQEWQIFICKVMFETNTLRRFLIVRFCFASQSRNVMML